MGIDLKGMTTETRNQNTLHLDSMSSLEIVTVMNQEDAKVPQAIHKHLDKIAKVVELAVECLEKGGRIIYMGAGTSGRLAVSDASECPPTFGVRADVVIGLMAGGDQAYTKAVEGAEDSVELAVNDLKRIHVSDKDIVIGLAASGRTPYVVAGLQYAHQLHAKTASIACNENSEIGKVADVAIEVVVGPEVLTGSTRLKAGTAQKLILNMISTAAMVRTGKAYENLMVDVVQTNEKLSRRAEKIVM
ncbi:MAG: N-acetylmuramic acid 6-phosphate etherase, partial [Erysipelotrichaceae bacterium]|nr:N-acetylmuramic acid 6-phosphate etherase [Erysipelotrichaceae bacterium]